MKKILVVSVNWLGDVVFSTPVYRALKAAYPQARVSVLAVPRVKQVLELCPDIDEVIVFDENAKDRGFFARLLLAGALRAKKFDAVFVLRRSLTRTWIAWLAGIPVRVGFAKKSWRSLLTHVVNDEGCDGIHRCDVYLRVVESFGVKATDRSCRLVVGRDHVDRVSAKLQAKGVGPDERFVVLNTGGNWNLKQWPQEYFSELARRLKLELGFRIVISGAHNDIERAQAIAKASGTDAVVFAGETDIAEMAALFKRAHSVISADSGPLHVASAVGANVVAIFGPTSPDITGPRGQGRIKVLMQEVGCNQAPCYYLQCPENRCMSATTVEHVLQTYKVLKG